MVISKRMACKTFLKMYKKYTLLLFTFLISCSLKETYNIKINSQYKIISTQIKIYKGDTVYINAYGKWTMNYGRREQTGPEGHNFLYPDGKHKWGMLFAKIGNKTFPVGKNVKIISPVTGYLFLYPFKGDYTLARSKGSLYAHIQITRNNRTNTEVKGKKLKVRVIYFVPKKVNVTENDYIRIRRTLSYIKKTYKKALSEQGIKNNFNYQFSSGKIKIYTINGKYKPEYYQGAPKIIRNKIRREVNYSMQKYGYNTANSVFLVISKNLVEIKNNVKIGWHALGSLEKFPGGSAYISDSVFFDYKNLKSNKIIKPPNLLWLIRKNILRIIPLLYRCSFT